MNRKSIYLILSLLILLENSEGFLWGTTSLNDTDIVYDLCSAESKCKCPDNPSSYAATLVNCSNLEIEQFPNNMLVPSGISRFDFTRNKIKSLDNVIFNNDSDKITYLDFSFNLLTGIDSEDLKKFPQLLTIFLRNNSISILDPEAFTGLKFLDILDLGYNQITDFPDTIFDGLPLSELKIGFNPIKELRSRLFDNLTFLKSLDLSGLQLTTLDHKFFNHQSRLSSLDLSSNNIEALPLDVFENVKYSLQTLFISNNPITSIGNASFPSLMNLETLYMNDMNKLEEIQGYSFQGMHRLTNVIIQNASMLSKIDDKAFHVEEGSRVKCPIKELIITETKLERFGRNLIYWDLVKDLKISSNNWNCDCKMAWLVNNTVAQKNKNVIICDQPENFHDQNLQLISPSDLGCKNGPVPIVIPGDSWSICSPDTVCNCPKTQDSRYMAEIDCSSRDINQVHDHMIIPLMYSKLDFSQNMIKYLNNETFSLAYKDLQHLDFSSNKIDILGVAVFSNLKNLKTIDLHNNKLFNINSRAFKGMKNLETLDLHFNNLNHIPDDLFDPLINLISLNLGYNDINAINGRWFNNLKKLEKLDLSYLKITNLHVDAFTGLHLKNLDLNHNLLEEVPVKALQPISHTLNTLTLSGNLIEELKVDAFVGLKELREINLKLLLKLKKIGPYAFAGLHRLESVQLMYLPKIKSIDKDAFRLNLGDNATCPIKDFILAFTAATTLDKDLLRWDQLSFLDMKNNRWKCDCNMAWMKDSNIENMVGNEMYCNEPLHLRGYPFKSIHKDALTCNFNIEEHQNVTLIVVLVLLVLGFCISLSTVAFLFYKKNGFVFRRPKPTFNYDRLSNDQGSVMTIEG